MGWFWQSLRTVFLKSSNFINGAYFGELAKAETRLVF